MNRTFTPRLGPAVLKRLEAYAERFRPHFNRARQARWAGVYLRGLLLEGERKSIEPLSRRVSRPAELGAVADPEQALQQFVSQSSWDEAAVARQYRATLAEALADPEGVFVVDSHHLSQSRPAFGGGPAPALRGFLARRPTANAPCRCIRWPRKVTAPCRCGCSCPPLG